MSTREFDNFLGNLQEEILQGALKGDSTLLEFLGARLDEVMDAVVAEIMSHPEGDIAAPLIRELPKFCRERAKKVVREFALSEVKYIQRKVDRPS